MGRSTHRRGVLLVAAAAITAEAAALKVQSGRFAGRVPVRCRAGHLFTTIWIPGASVKSARLVWWRLQWCPVGRHVTLVRPVREDALTADEQHAAGATRDIALP